MIIIRVTIIKTINNDSDRHSNNSSNGNSIRTSKNKYKNTIRKKNRNKNKIKIMIIMRYNNMCPWLDLTEILLVFFFRIRFQMQAKALGQCVAHRDAARTIS